MYKLRTVDVWDTLLRRRCHPDCSKLESARALLLKYHSLIMPDYLDPWAIYLERCLIEGEFSQDPYRSDGEYEIKEVFASLLERILCSNSKDISVLINWLISVEFEFELRQTYPDPGIANFLEKNPAEKTLFLSDFYMPSIYLVQLLQYHQLSYLVSEGITSCEAGYNKRTGNLFHYVHQNWKIHPSEHIHIGDNLHSDVNVPLRLGIKSLHFQPKIEHRKRQERASYLTDRKALFRYLSDESMRSAQEEANNLCDKAKSAFLLGIQTAPLWIGFILYIAEKALIDRLENLYFFTREGEFFIQVWRNLFSNNKLSSEMLPASRVLAVSRISTFCASLGAISVEEMMRLWNLYSTQSLYALFKTIGLSPDLFVDICRSNGLELTEEIIYPWKDKRIQSLFQDPNFCKLIQDKIVVERNKLMHYLKQQDIGLSASIGIIDIGWRGTIQDNLALLLPNIQIYGYYLGLQRFLNDQPANCKKTAFGPNANHDRNYQHLLDAVSVIEMLCNSTNGSVTTYYFDENGFIHPDRLIDPDENAVYDEFTAYFQKGVLHSSRVWAEFIDSQVISSREIRQHGLHIWSKLMNKTHIELSQSYAILKHNEIFGVGSFVDKNTVPSIMDLAKGIFLPQVRLSIFRYIRQTQWTAGIWGRQDLNLIHKSLLMLILYLAKIYKRIRYWWIAYGR